jgi:uncharacterized protein (DUF2141 family)
MFITTLVAAYLATAAPPPASLTFSIDQLKPAKGYVMIGLYAGKDAYDSERRLRSERVAVNAGRVDITLTGLAPGDYALKLFHDVNGNAALDTNMLGIPVEPVAFSNNAKGAMGPPSWAKAQFTLVAPASQQVIHFQSR